MEHLHLKGMSRREAGFQEYGILPYRHVCARVSPVHAHRCKNLRPQQFVGTVNTHSMATQILYSAKAEGAILKKRGLGSMQSVLDGPSAARTT